MTAEIGDKGHANRSWLAPVQHNNGGAKEDYEVTTVSSSPACWIGVLIIIEFLDCRVRTIQARLSERSHEWNGKGFQGGLAPQEPGRRKGELARRLQGHQSSGMSTPATALLADDWLISRVYL